MTRTKLIFGGGALAAVLIMLVVALALSHVFARPASQAAQAPAQPLLVDPALNPPDYVARFLALQITPPDSRFRPGQNASCSTGTGVYTTRCVLNLIDAARYEQNDQVVIYQLRQDSDYQILQTQMEAALQNMPDASRLSVDDSGTLNTKSGQAIGNINIVCEQASGDGVQSDGVCLGHYAPGIAVGAAVFPLTSLDGVDAEHPPDVERAEALESEALLAVYDAIGVSGK